MAVYKCSVCGYVFDEEKEGKSFSELDSCPVCKQPVGKFEPVDKFELVEERKADTKTKTVVEQKEEKKLKLQYDSAFVTRVYFYTDYLCIVSCQKVFRFHKVRYFFDYHRRPSGIF